MHPVNLKVMILFIAAAEQVPKLEPKEEVTPDQQQKSKRINRVVVVVSLLIFTLLFYDVDGKDNGTATENKCNALKLKLNNV